MSLPASPTRTACTSSPLKQVPQSSRIISSRRAESLLCTCNGCRYRSSHTTHAARPVTVQRRTAGRTASCTRWQGAISCQAFVASTLLGLFPQLISIDNESKTKHSTLPHILPANPERWFRNLRCTTGPPHRGCGRCRTS